jgi:molybdenum-dependent DNA-binding transcriptional regulator ModE
MNKTLRGRPRLDLELAHILEAVRRHGQVVAAAYELGCSDAYIHVRLKQVSLTLREVLNAPNLGVLLGGGDNL